VAELDAQGYLPEQPQSDRSEEAILRRFGYHQEFQRVIRGFSSFAISFSNASVTTGTLLAIGSIFAIAGGAGVWVFVVNAVLMLCVGAVYATLAARMPITGIEYQWASKLTNPVFGTFLGWLSFGVVTVSTVAVDYVLASTVLPALFNYTSSTDTTVWVTAIIIAAQGILLGVSTKWTARVNSVVVVSELVVVLGLTILFVIVGAARGLFVPHNLVSEGSAAGHGYFNPFASFKGVGAFWLLITISFFSISDGFQGCANAVEETQDSQSVVPRSMMQTLIFTGAIQILLTIAIIVVSHDVGALATSPIAMSNVVVYVLGTAVDKVFLVIAVFNVFACGLVVYLQMARYMWAMARDGLFPVPGVFRKVSHRFGTPLNATVLSGALLLAVLAFFGFHTGAFNNLIGAGGLCAIIVYLLVMILFAVAGHRIPVPAGKFSLGRWQWPIVVLAIVWLLFAMSVFRYGFGPVWEYVGGLVVVGFIYMAWVLTHQPKWAHDQSGTEPEQEAASGRAS
jgi:amino acid transporter